jgi:hypothetical protein|tara:strand:- start:408 stop:926 length:519 start_codon:yes stop_codon:yes gene_type:complete
MKKFIQDDNLLSKKEIEFINATILKHNFPWFYSKESNKGDSYWFYSHSVIERIEESGKHTSYISPFCVSLLDKFCKKHKIKYEKILRCCLNTNFAQENKSFMHTDHDSDYNHLLIYLTNNKDGKTLLFNDDKKTINKKITPKKFRAVSFSKCWHIGTSPKKDRRVVLVYTFK